MNEEKKINWDESAKSQFDQMIEKIPWPVRKIASDTVEKKAKELVSKDGRSTIKEKDMVDAFFAETPSGFIPQMKTSMEELGINYTQYGYDK